jgi:diguanylate cyclase
VEITESAIMIDPAHALQVLDRLNQLGVQVSIDDFGTGYSSMAHLKSLPAGAGGPWLLRSGR